MDFENDMSIDETALDVEWLEQPRLMIKYAQIAAEAKRRFDKAKEQVEVIKADRDKDIRTNPSEYEITKITETVIQNTIVLQGDYKEAQLEMIDAKYEFEMSRYAVQAMQERKEALENLVKLYGMQYFAGPSVPRDLSQEWQKKQNQKESNSKVKMKRKK